MFWKKHTDKERGNSCKNWEASFFSLSLLSARFGKNNHCCNSVCLPPTTMELKVPLFLILAAGVSLCSWFRSVRWQTASQTLENTVRDSVIGCAENLLLGSLRTYQSSLTYVFKATLLAARCSCHGNPNAISPIVWTARYPESFFRVLLY